MQRDPFSRMIEGFERTLARISDLKTEEKWTEVEAAIGQSLRRFIQTPLREISSLTQAGMLAQLIRNGLTFWVPYQKMMVSRLLKEAGDCARRKAPPRGGDGWYLKALMMVLDVAHVDEIGGCYALLPNLDELLENFEGAGLPPAARLALAREYERK